MSAGKTSGLNFLMRFIYLLAYPRALSLDLYFLPYIIIAEHDVEHLYADDTQIYISLSGSEALESLTDLKSCVLKLNPSKTELSSSVLKNKDKSSKIYSLYYYLTMTHFLRHSLEIWASFFIVILTSNDKSLRLAKYASITSGIFGVLGSTLAQKLQNLLHVL